jgi:predicted alpha/beta superfamily hydrolase
MRLAAILFATAVAASCAPSLRPAHSPAAAAMGTGYAEGDRLPAHDTFSLRSRALGEVRTLNVYLPPQYRPGISAARLPVLYMPDGGLDEDFPHVANTVDSLIALRRIRPVLVVGIANTERRRDLTGPTRFAADSQIAVHVGGSAVFRTFIRDELIPEVERRYHTSAERAIIGESLAGLFVVETYLSEPALFTHYIALDPSLWWNGGALADTAPAALGDAAHGGSQPRTFNFASSGEERGTGSSPLAAALRAAAPASLRWRYEARPDLTHGNIFRSLKPAALADALR